LCIFRFFYTYGPKQSKHFVISKFLSTAFNNQDITIYGDGRQTRTFCYIDDNIAATSIIFKNNLFINDVVNIGNDNETQIIDLAKIILKLTGSKSKIVFLPPLQEGDMSRRLPDINRIKPLLNNKFISLEKGILKILEEGLLDTSTNK